MPPFFSFLFLATLKILIKAQHFSYIFIINTMKEEGVSNIFVEAQWNSHIPEKYAIATR